MKKLWIFLALSALISCNNNQANAQDNTQSNRQENSQNETDTQIDIPEGEEMDRNAAVVFYKSGNNAIFDGSEKMTATVIIQKDQEGLAIAFQLAGEDGKSIATTIAKIPENFSLPLKSTFTKNNLYDGKNPLASLIILATAENGLADMPFEGTLTITKLSEDAIEYTIEGKGGGYTDADNPSKWKNITSSVKITTPIILSQGIDKNKVLK
jgi:hypothetical protein